MDTPDRIDRGGTHGHDRMLEQLSTDHDHVDARVLRERIGDVGLCVTTVALSEAGSASASCKQVVPPSMNTTWRGRTMLAAARAIARLPATSTSVRPERRGRRRSR